MKTVLTILFIAMSFPLFAENEYVMRPPKGLCFIPDGLNCVAISQVENNIEIHCNTTVVSKIGLIHNFHYQVHANELISFPIQYVTTQKVRLDNGFTSEVDFYKTCRLQVEYPKR